MKKLILLTVLIAASCATYNIPRLIDIAQQIYQDPTTTPEQRRVLMVEVRDEHVVTPQIRSIIAREVAKIDVDIAYNIEPLEARQDYLAATRPEHEPWPNALAEIDEEIEHINQLIMERDKPPPPAPPSGGGAHYCQKFVTYRNGFLWKPKSESDNRLVVLLPSAIKGKWKQVEIVGQEIGRFVGDVHNGNRPHFRFSKTGAGYGDNITLLVTYQNGSVTEYKIPRGCARVE